jgi:hypothetical protein
VVAKPDCVCVVKSYLVIWLFMIASLNSVWLQQQGRLWLQKNYSVCVIANISGYFMIAKKGPEQCVFATSLCVWLQPLVICGCNMTMSV